MNGFLNKIYEKDTYTENGALSNSTTKSAILDYFSKAGTFRNREIKEVFTDLFNMWAESPQLTLKTIFYNRMISRKTYGFVHTDEVQFGQGNRSEFRKSLIWLSKFKPDVLYKNLWLIPIVGTWKDLWHREVINNLDFTEIYRLIDFGLKDSYNKELIAKYLPRIRSASNTKNFTHKNLNAFALGFCRYKKWSPKMYRTFKSSGKAHIFQKQISRGKINALNFDHIPGKALFNLAAKKGNDGKSFMERHLIEDQYMQWLKTSPKVKFTGYVYELMNCVNEEMTLSQKMTVDLQFDYLLNLSKAESKLNKNIWCALDTSGSMGVAVANTTAYNICISLGVFFSSLNQGAFKDHVIMFDSYSRKLRLKGSFSDKVLQITRDRMAMGSTNFQSVIDEIVRIRKENPRIPIEDFPEVLIVVSDMQFNPVSVNNETNYEKAMKKLRAAGLPDITIVWWWVTGRGTDFPSHIDDKATICIGGFDGNIINLLLGKDLQREPDQDKKISPFEAMEKALSQDVLNLIQL